MVALRAPRSRAARSLPRSSRFWTTEKRVPQNPFSLPRGSARDWVTWSRSALRGHALRGVSLVRHDSGRRKSVSPRILPHSREAPHVTGSHGRAPRSAVTRCAESPSFVTILDDGKACPPESFLTPERLRT